MDVSQIERELRAAARDCTARGLTVSAKWAAEQLTGLGSKRGFTAGPKRSPTSAAVMMAKTMFDVREYDRVVQLLEGEVESEGVFLRCFARFKAGDRRKEEQMQQMNSCGLQEVVNEAAASLAAELENLCKQPGPDPFLLFLSGLVLKELGEKEASRTALCQSVRLYPCNWQAWLALAQVHDHDPSKSAEGLPDHWMRKFFDAHISSSPSDPSPDIESDASQRYSELHQTFPESRYVLAQRAAAHYTARDFDSAETFFQHLLKQDPCRVETLDLYSHILYVKEKRTELSVLARNALRVNKYCPETCCILGNHYTLKGVHDKAVMYFQRALRLDRNYLEAWTLLGHEYVEMKDTASAVHAYRRAVDANPRDFRAWYGLGQTYEILKMPLYSLFYYQKSTELRPHDARMWCALAECHECLGQTEEAVRCYRRAMSSGDNEGIALCKLAVLSSKLGEEDAAAGFWKQVLETHGDEQSVTSQEVVDALTFMSQHCFKKAESCEAEDPAQKVWLQEARKCCERLLDCPIPEKEDAKLLLTQIERVLGMGAEGGVAP